MKKKTYQKCVDKMSHTMSNRNSIAKKMGDTVTPNAIYDEWVVDGIDPEVDDYEFLFLEDLTQV